jgi:hypothetical protein
LQVRKSSSLSEQERGMSEAAVNDAREWANKLVINESRGPGDLDNAIRRISQRYGIDYWEIWGLRYRPPKRIFLDLYVRLQGAYRAECERQMRLLEHELAITKTIAGDDHAAVRTAETLVRANAGRKVEATRPPVNGGGD